MKKVPKYQHSHYGAGNSNTLQSPFDFGASGVTRHINNTNEIECIKVESMGLNTNGETSVSTILDNSENNSEACVYFSKRDYALAYARYLREKTGIEILGG